MIGHCGGGEENIYIISPFDSLGNVLSSNHILMKASNRKGQIGCIVWRHLPCPTSIYICSIANAICDPVPIFDPRFVKLLVGKGFDFIDNLIDAQKI
mmetsp:Transcript_34542/g.70661  ORF Transcript_34542/g.70661 Transcript_34542/m.70661 type:complete len:97 (+) Transcript_34542:93-383(+)